MPNFTFSFYLLTIGLLVLSIFIISKSNKIDKKWAKNGAYIIVGILFVLYVYNLFDKPYILNSQIVVHEYYQLDTNRINKVVITNKTRKDKKNFKKRTIIKDKKRIFELCSELRNLEKFNIEEPPKNYKTYDCEIFLKNGEVIEFPIKVSKIYGCFIEIYAPGNFYYEHLGNYKNDELKLFLENN